MARTRRRHGSVRRLPSGRWQVRYLDAAGERRTALTTYATKTEAARFLSALETDVSRGQWVDPRSGQLPLVPYVKDYLATLVHLAPKTVASYESLVRTTIEPRFADAMLADVRPVDVRMWVAALSGRGLSPSRVRQAYNLLGAAMATAVVDGLLAGTPCIGVKLPRIPKPSLTYLTAQQVADLAAAMAEPYGLLVDILAYGGLRFGEMAGLRRRRVDPLHGQLYIAESLGEVDGRLTYGPTKTHQDRVVVLPRSVATALADHLERHVDLTPDAPVFTALSGGALRYSNFRRDIWDPAVEKAGLRGVTPHVLRHTSATLLIAAGASVKDVQAHLGHADASVTLNIYASVIEGRRDELAEHLELIRQQLPSSS